MRSALAVGVLALGLGVVTAPAAAADPTVSETTGGVTNTWTNYTNAGGTAGPRIPAYTTVQIACKLHGFRVANGNTWWYRIASGPWNNAFYASADAFYNNGQTSGSLLGTPWVDPAVPDCGAPPAPPPPPAPRPNPSVQLAQGPAAPAGYRYAITLDNFAPGSRVSVSCRDSVSPGGFSSFGMTTDGRGHAFTQSACYSGDGPEHWVVAGGVGSNRAIWGPANPGGGAPPPSGGSTGAGGGIAPKPSSPPRSTSPPPPGSRDICLSAYRNGGTQRTHSIFGGSETIYDRTASVYQVCGGFGAPDSMQYSPAMQCALIAAVATYGGPVVNKGVAWGCTAGSVIEDFRQGDWLGAAAGFACGFFAEVFAEGVGIFVAGAASPIGPAAAVIGYETYRALSASLKIACSGLLDGGAAALGYNIESRHQARIAVDVERRGKCIRQRRVFGLVSWSAVNCP